MSMSILEHFAVILDPRVERTRKHKLGDILAVAVCAVICGAECWTHIAEFGRANEAWFRSFLDLPHGIPSHDTFGRVFAALDPEAFEGALRAWIANLAGSSRGKHIAIDGKTLRRSFDRANANGFAGEHDRYETAEKGHGRLDIRRTWCSSEVAWVQARHDWPGLASLTAVEREYYLRGQRKFERRYFLSSHSGRCAQRLGTLIRNHWRVEAQLHWLLDVCFHEDASRVRIANAAENLSRVRRIALMLLKQDTTAQVGVAGKRLKAGWDRNYLLKVLNI
jgi:predicted transposase YbfD/YdcC